MLRLKENKTVSKHFSSDCRVYSGIKDAFGNRCYVVENYRLKEFRIVGKNPRYSTDRKKLPKYIVVPKYLPVTDLNRSVARELEAMFPDYIHNMWAIWDDPIWDD